MLRVTGRKEGLEQLPDGVFIEDNSSDCETSQRFIQAAKRRGIATTKERVRDGPACRALSI